MKANLATKLFKDTRIGGTKIVRNNDTREYSSVMSRNYLRAINTISLLDNLTQENMFEDRLELMKRYYVEHIPEDNIPYIFINIHEEDDFHKDTTAAVQLTTWFILDEKTCKDTLDSLVSVKYLKEEKRKGILKHAFGDFNPDKNNKDTSHMMADMYFMKALKSAAS